MRRLKEEEIHSLIETCGLFNFTSFEEQVLPYVQSIYMDIKPIDTDGHRRYCCVSNGVILENCKKLQPLSQ